MSRSKEEITDYEQATEAYVSPKLARNRYRKSSRFVYWWQHALGIVSFVVGIAAWRSSYPIDATFLYCCALLPMYVLAMLYALSLRARIFYSVLPITYVVYHLYRFIVDWIA